MNTIGTLFRLTSFGESHGPAIGGVVDGMPAGIAVDETFIQAELDRRRPGQSRLTTARNESDKVELLSGIFNGRTTGTPIGFIVRNADHHSADYDDLANAFRPSHADFTYQSKYGIRDHRGGGRSSARETVSRVVAGALARLALRECGISITAFTSRVGNIALDNDYTHYDLSQTEQNLVRCPDPGKAALMQQLIEQVRAQGDTIGGTISCVVKGCPAGLGSPVFGKLHADLGAAMLSINAAKGFDYGLGFDGLNLRGSEQNDIFCPQENSAAHIGTQTNNSGGIQGGISNGQDIYFRVAFKPAPTLLREQPTVKADGQPTVIKPHGRHDPCVLPRAVPIVEAMAAITLLDHWLMRRADHLF